MRRALFALAALCAPLTATPAQAPPPGAVTDPSATPIAQNPAEVARRVDAHLRRLVPFGFNGAVLLARGGTVLLSEGYGLADRESNTPMRAGTGFDIGSITKQFTAAAIVKLESEGKLSVNDPLTRWFSDVPEDKRGMTLHHLLTHTSGLRDVFGGDYEVAERDSLVRVILNSRLNAPPPAPYDYSNSGYSLLAAVVENASGMKYEDYLRTKLFAPAGLTRTGYRGVTWQPGELAVGYRAGQRWGTPLDHLWATDGPYWNLRGNGGILSTLPDLYRWHLALQGNAVLPEEARNKLWMPHAPEGPGGNSAYGYGWSVSRTLRNTKLVAHNGGNGIFFADFRRYVDEDVVFLIASSVTEASGNAAQQQLLRLIFGGEYFEPPAIASGSIAVPPALTGTYRISPASALQVEVAGNRLRLSGTGQEAFALLRGVRNQPRFQTLSEAGVRAIEAAERGDSAAFTAVFDTPARGAEFVQLHREFSRNVTAQIGPFRSVEAVGTIERGPRATSTLRLRYERGDRYIVVTWNGDRIVDINATRFVPYVDLMPVSASEWTAYDFSSGRTLRARFENGTLLIDTPEGPVRAPKR